MFPPVCYSRESLLLTKGRPHLEPIERDKSDPMGMLISWVIVSEQTIVLGQE